jgi:intraflagellar transport protein 81
MDRIAFIVDRLNMPPFVKNYATMTEIDSKSAMELLDLSCEIIVAVDKDYDTMLSQEPNAEGRLSRIISFLTIMKFTTPQNVRMDELQTYLQNGDKEAWILVLHWLLQKYEHLQKRAYLAKYLMPVDVPGEFMSDSLIVELLKHLKGGCFNLCC